MALQDTDSLGRVRTRFGGCLGEASLRVPLGFATVSSDRRRQWGIHATCRRFANGLAYAAVHSLNPQTFPRICISITPLPFAAAIGNTFAIKNLQARRTMGPFLAGTISQAPLAGRCSSHSCHTVNAPGSIAIYPSSDFHRSIIASPEADTHRAPRNTTVHRRCLMTSPFNLTSKSRRRNRSVFANAAISFH
jgi:hypothetical protein